LPRTLRLRDGHVDLDQGVVERASQRARLTTLELRLLEYLASRPGEEVDRDELLRVVWGYHPDVITRSVDNTVRRLRLKIEADPREPHHVLTVFRLGYRFEPAPTIEPGPPAAVEGVPPDRGRFFGRSEDLERLREAVVPGGLAAVVGPPGVGKSRLVREWLRAGDAPGPLAWCALGAATCRSDVLLMIARVLEVRPGGKDDLDERLARALVRRGASTLVLDETEQGQEAVDALLRTWLQETPQTRWVLTSRRLPKVASVGVVGLDPLPQGPARALLLDRGQQAGGADWGTGVEAEAVDQLTSRLEGLPLALELASARAHLLRPTDLVERLDERLDRLATRPGRGPADRTSLRAALETSWHLLPEADQGILADLSVFHGPFGLSAAEGVFGDVLDALERLVDHSLLRAGTATPPGRGVRFQLLETIRLFALERLEEQGRTEAVGIRHARWHARLVEDLAGPARRGDPEAVERLLEPLDDLLAILRDRRWPERAGHIALGLHPCVRDRLPTSDWVALLRTVLGHLPETAGELASELRLALVESLTISGQRHEAQQELAVSPPESPTLRALHLHRQGTLLHLAEQREEAAATFEEAIELLSDPDQVSDRAHALVSLGAVRLRLARFEAAREAYDEALRVARGAGDRRVLWRCHCALANLASHGQTDITACLDHYRQALAIADDLGDDRGRAMVRLNRALVHRMRQEPELAEEDYRAALAAVEAQGFGRARGHALLGLANLLRERRRTREARGLLLEALEATRVHSDRRFEAHVLDSLAVVAHLEGRLSDAEERYGQALRLYTELGMVREGALVELTRAVLVGDGGRLEEARAALEQVPEASLLPGDLLVCTIHRAHLDLLQGQVPDLPALRRLADEPSYELRVRLALALLERAVPPQQS